MKKMAERTWAWLGILGLLGLAAGCLSMGTLRTVAVFDNEGHPIEGATISLGDRTGVARASTGSNGSARFVVEGGSLELVVSRPGYKMVQVPATTNVLIRVLMERE
jgi:hypothetical protein